MGLIKDGVKYGALFGVAHEASKAYSKSHNGNQQQQPQPQQQQQQYTQAAPMQTQHRDGSGYLHQSFCNAQCGHRCNGPYVAGGK